MNLQTQVLLSFHLPERATSKTYLQNQILPEACFQLPNLSVLFLNLEAGNEQHTSITEENSSDDRYISQSTLKRYAEFKATCKTKSKSEGKKEARF
jgi:hypothetical protein